MSCIFSPSSITKVSYPEDHHKLPGFVFSATVKNHLSFLKLNFLPPVALLIPSAFPALAVVPPVASTVSSTVPAPSNSLAVSSPALSFPCMKLDSMLWHHCFGHIRMDTTQAALTKNYVTGVRLDGSFIQEYCNSCIVGKSLILCRVTML